MKASIVITTKNRKESLRRAIASAVMQTIPVEIIVIDDGSTDGTSEMVTSEFPQVRLERAAQLAWVYRSTKPRGPFVVSRRDHLDRR